MLTEEQLAIRELRDVAYHEAGHRIICRRFGGDGDILISKNLSGNPDETAWRGQFRTRVCPQEMHDAFQRAGIRGPDLPDNWQVLFGMAGLVAEEIMREGAEDAELIANGVWSRILLGYVSATDLAMMGITDIDDWELNYKEVEQTLGYLKEEWPLVQDYADYHIAEALDELTLLRSKTASTNTCLAAALQNAVELNAALAQSKASEHLALQTAAELRTQLGT